MPSRLGLLVVLVALAGCGGGGGGDKPSGATSQSPPGSAQEKAVDTWARAAQAYWDDFRNCGSSVTAVHGFFAGCTKKTDGAFRQAGSRVLRELRRSKTAACKSVRADLRSLVVHGETVLQGTVRAFDRSNDASLDHRTYSGRPPQQLFLAGANWLEGDLPKASNLSRQIEQGC